MTKFSVALSKIAGNLNMETAYTPTALGEIRIETMDVNRPGLLLAGYDSHYEPSRIQILGNAEMAFLEKNSVTNNICGSLFVFILKVFYICTHYKLYLLI